MKLLLPGGMSKQRQGAASAGHAPLLQLAVCIAHIRNCLGKASARLLVQHWYEVAAMAWSLHRLADETAPAHTLMAA